MTDREFELSRRKILGSIGAVGAAGALGGAATNALLWDEEVFGSAEAPNILQAGMLDLNVGWEEHYYDSFTTDIGVRFIDSASDLEPGEVGLPTPQNPLVAVPEGSLEDFMGDTIIDESDLTDVDGPVVDITDVKPGDFGEVTFSYQLEGNPGFVTMCAERLADDENEAIEPELSAGDDEDVTDDLLDGELGDLIQAQLWYDPDCDNLVDEDLGTADIMIAVDTSGSIAGDEQDDLVAGVNSFIDALPTDDSVQVGTLTFGDNDIANVQGLDNPGDITFGTPSFGGNTPFPAALDIGDQAVRSDPNGNARSGARKFLIVFSDGGPNYFNENYTAAGGSYEAPRGSDDPGYSDDDGTDQYDLGGTSPNADVTKGEMDETALVAQTVRDNGTDIATVYAGGPGTDSMTGPAETAYTDLPTYLEQHIATDVAFDVDFGDLPGLASDIIAAITTSEEVIAEGTLNEVIAAMSECLLVDPASSGATLAEEYPESTCHAPGEGGCLALSWLLPRDIPGVNDNVVQTDRYAFTVGFNAVQCRHNVADDGGPIDFPGDAEAGAD